MTERIIAYRAAQTIQKCIRNWISGFPQDEVALLNRISEKFIKMNCYDISYPPALVDTKLVQLHRKGKNTKDKYGADLFISVKIPSKKFTKTAFFQTKVADSNKVKIEKGQLNEANSLPFVKNRSFTFSADKSNQISKIVSNLDLIKGIPTNNKSKTFNTNDPIWIRSHTWIYNWLKCKVGEVSDEQLRFEKILLELTDESSQSWVKSIFNFGDDVETEVLSNDFNLIRPTSWLIINFEDPIFEVYEQ